MAPTKKKAKAAKKTPARAKKAATKTVKKSAKKAVKKAVKKTAKKTVKKSAKKATPKTAAKSTVGSVAWTEFASSDPVATKTWAQKALGFKFGPSMPSPEGEYHMWSDGGIRTAMSPATPGTVVYIEVANLKRAYDKALKNGANSILAPMVIGPQMGSMAVVSAPGGVPVGLWAMK